MAPKLFLTTLCFLPYLQEDNMGPLAIIGSWVMADQSPVLFTVLNTKPQIYLSASPLHPLETSLFQDQTIF